MKALLIALSILFASTISACRPLDPVVPLPDDIPIEIIKAHVGVNAKGTNEAGLIAYSGRGSGIAVAKKNGRIYVLTARHAIEPEPHRRHPGYTYEPQVWENEYTFTEARTEEVGRYGLDAAIISYIPEGPSPSTVAISYRRPIRQEAVFVFGSPASAFRVIRRGRIAGSCYRITASCELATPVLPGFSGGGIYNGYEKLLGMTIARRHKDNNEGIFIPASKLWPLVTRALRNR